MPDTASPSAAPSLNTSTPGSTLEIIRLAVPLVLANSFMTIQVTVDRVLLSQDNSDAIAAAMPAVMCFWTPLTLLQQTCAYATTFVAQYVGANRPHRVGPAVWQGLWFALVGGIAFLGLIPMAGTLAQWSGHPEGVQLQEAMYFRCLCFAALPTLITAAASGFFAGRGDSWTVLIINAAGTAVNGVLAYLLVFGKFGLPKLGIEGAGWAAVAAAWVSAGVALALFLRPRWQREFNTHHWWPEGELFGRLMWHGLPNGVQWALDGLAFTVFLLIIGRLGTIEMAATSIAFTINMFAFLPMIGVGQAVEIMVGQRLGQDRPDLAAKSTWAAFRVVLVYMTIMAGLYTLTPWVFLMWFENTNEPETWAAIAAMVPLLLRFVALYSLFDGVNAVFSFALRGAGDTKFVTVVSLLLAWPLMVFPSWWALRSGWNVYWPWGFASVYICIMAGVFLARFLGGRWKTMRVIEPEGRSPA